MNAIPRMHKPPCWCLGCRQLDRELGVKPQPVEPEPEEDEPAVVKTWGRRPAKAPPKIGATLAKTPSAKRPPAKTPVRRKPAAKPRTPASSS